MTIGREKREGLTLSLSLELEAFVNVLGYGSTVAGFEQVHIAYCALGCLAAAADVVLGSHALEVDVPAVELVLSHDEVRSLRSRLLRGGSDGRNGLDSGNCGFFSGATRCCVLSDFLFCGFFSFLCHDIEVFGV